MRTILSALLVLVSIGCTTTPAPKLAPDPGQTGVEPVGRADTCAEFNAQQKTIDAAEHTRTFGCPPCPCACVNGEITCAPCALCMPPDERHDIPPEPVRAPPQPLKITFVDVDEGDAILIQSGDFDALIDTGGGGAWDGQLDAALATVKGPLELVFVTHPHEDHLGQADKVLGKLQVLRVITTGETRGPPRDKKALAFYERYTAALAAEGVTAEPATIGESFDPAPGIRFEGEQTARRDASGPPR